MAPELIIAVEAKLFGWTRSQTRVHLLVRCPELTVAEIDRQLANIYDGEARSNQDSTPALATERR
jgi:hypothetical protein